jgi:hypothetical protein
LGRTHGRRFANEHITSPNEGTGGEPAASGSLAGRPVCRDGAVEGGQLYRQGEY